MRIMRLLVMFDLPTKTKSNKDAYIKFRRFLEDDGYIREQNSIYSRNLLSRASAEAHAEQLRKNLPPAGHVVAMQFTEKQYVDREILVNTGISGSWRTFERTVPRTFASARQCSRGDPRANVRPIHHRRQAGRTARHKP